MINGECAKGASNEARINGLEDNLMAFRRDFIDLRKTIEVALKRPGWAVTVMVSAMSGVIAALIMALVNKPGG